MKKLVIALSTGFPACFLHAVNADNAKMHTSIIANTLNIFFFIILFLLMHLITYRYILQHFQPFGYCFHFSSQSMKSSLLFRITSDTVKEVIKEKEICNYERNNRERWICNH